MTTAWPKEDPAGRHSEMPSVVSCTPSRIDLRGSEWLQSISDKELSEKTGLPLEDNGKIQLPELACAVSGVDEPPQDTDSAYLSALESLGSDPSALESLSPDLELGGFLAGGNLMTGDFEGDPLSWLNNIDPQLLVVDQPSTSVYPDPPVDLSNEGG